MDITEQEIKSVVTALRGMFPTLPKEYVEDAVSDKLLLMLEKGYKMNAGNLFTLSKFGLFKEIKKTGKYCSYTSSHAELKAEMDEDKYLPIKDGTVDSVIEHARKLTDISERDMNIFIEATISKVPVYEVAEKEGLAVSPTYRIIKRVKKKVQEVASFLTEND